MMGPTEIQTFTGNHIDVFDIKQEAISIFDIAHALAANCRFNGHTKGHLSVAEHSVFVSRYVSPENALAGLLHDAAEAYITDVPKPIKRMLPRINELDAQLTEAVFKKFRCDYPIDEEIHHVDKMICYAEAKCSGMNVAEWGWQPETELVHEVEWWDAKKAELEFLRTFNILMEGELRVL